MVKEILLDEIALQEDISEEKASFLEACKTKINEAVHIFVGTSPLFKESLAQGQSQFKVIVESSKQYDAEVVAGPWCYVDFVATNKEAEERVHVSRSSRNDFLFSYKGQDFRVVYGSIPKRPKK